jgi:hypothetical protein
MKGALVLTDELHHRAEHVLDACDEWLDVVWVHEAGLQERDRENGEQTIGRKMN